MHRHDNWLRRPVRALGIALAAGVLFVPSPSAQSGVDIAADVGAATQRGVNATISPSGSTVTVTRLTFVVATGVELITPVPARARVQFDLPAGLRWGPVAPTAAEGCTSTPSSATCESPELQPITGRTGWGWEWDAIAEATGSYVLRSRIVGSSAPDPDPSNDSASITVIVTSPAPTAGPASVFASSAAVEPASPRAGAVVRGTVSITSAGDPIRPTGIACVGTIGATKVKGTPRAAVGSASCAFRTPRSAKRKTLRASLAFTAAGQRVTRRFAVRLR